MSTNEDDGKAEARQRTPWPSFLDAALRFTWPIILAQFFAIATLVVPQQGQEVLREALTEGFGIKFLLSSLLFSAVLWMLSRTILRRNTTYDRKKQTKAAKMLAHQVSEIVGMTAKDSTDNVIRADTNTVYKTLDGDNRFIFSAWISVIFLIFIGLYSAFAYQWWYIYFSLIGVFFAYLLRNARLNWPLPIYALIWSLTLILLLAVILFPVPLSLWVSSVTGPYLVLFLAIFPILIFMLVFVHIIYNRKRPITDGIVALFLLGSIWILLPDYHEIRLLSISSNLQGQPSKQIPAATEVLQSWQKNNPDRIMVIVAAAGGGVRAAYWTAAILAKIEDAYPDFYRHIFAISAVSGGSLGAAAFDAALDTTEPKCGTKIGYQACLEHFLSFDFMSPILASQLTGDLFRGFSPLKWWLGKPDDRGTVLEVAWENAWRSTFSGERGSRFANPFVSLWDEVSRPALLLNGTSAVTGKRLITSNLALTGDADQVIENLATLPMALSTAVNNSTRFPFIEPAGGFPSRANNQTAIDYVVDGGYFDNYGAATVLDLLLEVKNELQDKRVVIVQITSDPEVTTRLDKGEQLNKVSSVQGEACQPSERSDEPTHMGTIDGVLHAAMAARSHTGIIYATILRDRAVPLIGGKEGNVRWIQFGMPSIELPLGWNLSANNRRCIDSLLAKDPVINERIGELIKFLKGS